MLNDNDDGSIIIMAGDIEYYRRRELHERRMARRTRCKHARRIHANLAGFYASRRAAIAPGSPAGPSFWQTVLDWFAGLRPRV